MYKEIIERYEKYKDPIIDRDTYNVEEWMEIVSEYISFTDYCFLLIMFLVSRLFFSWRLWIVIYISIIFSQACFSYKYIYFNIKPNIIGYNFIITILSNLVIPFGNLIRTNINSHYRVILNGGGSGLVITTSPSLNFKPFAEQLFSTKQHPKMPLTLFKQYCESFDKYDFITCERLLNDMNINQAKYFINMSSKHMLKFNSCSTPRASMLTQLFENDYQRYMFNFNDLILERVEEMYNVKYNFPKDKLNDLNSLDSSQKEVSTSNIFLKSQQNFKKLQELMDSALLSQGDNLTISIISNVKEPGTHADFYVIPSKVTEISRSILFLKKKSRETYQDIKSIIEQHGLSESTIIAQDVNRKSTSNIEETINSIRNKKINRFYDNCELFPQSHHQLGVILPGSTTKKDKDFIDYEINKYIEGKNILASGPRPSLSFKSVIDTFLD